ncbi:MAG: S8 family serine peptidase [Clostridia bacterium]|nr:S8 family serine peptidase [Clostridia bacterium]
MKNFKSIVALLLCAVMALATASCSVTTSEANDETPVLNEGVQGIPENSLGVPDQTTYPSPTINQLDKTTQQGLLEADDHEIKDTDGSFTVPFDIAYPEAFEAGVFEYDPTVLLLKMDSEFDGRLTSALKACGFEALEAFCAVTDGTWYRATLTEGTVITEAATKARALEEILMVDYDYLSEKASDDETEWWDSAVDSNPRVNEQWYLDSCHIQETWAHLAEQGINPGGSSSIIVAVIDTGVDYTHPDLASSMWVNPGEIPGNGIDDDGNGYKDDVHGCSTIGSSYDHSGNPMDDHGHGTHVAGIIGAANNKEGIVGIAYNTKIMAVKAGQATGVFNQSDIAEASLYAYENGAEVINMSFGGTACSLAVQEALEIAWTRAVLVASAGNNGEPNEDWGEQGTNIVHYGTPNYPAALNYVIGVMSINRLGMESIFTNWDTKANNSVEYEVYAPGEDILSTLPGGKYGYLSGTSMAAPVVSAIAALLRSKYTDRDVYPAKFIDGQICASSEEYSICWNSDHAFGHNEQMVIDAYAAMTKLPKPDVYLYDYYLFDDTSISGKNNSDGDVNAGETLNIGAVLYNRWGMSKDTVIQIDSIGGIMGEENPYVEIITGTSNFDGVGTYSTKDQFVRDQNGLIVGVDEPLIVKIKDDCPNDYTIVLNVTLSYKNGLDEKDIHSYIKKADDNGIPICITFSVRNGAQFPNVIDKDTVITNDKYYILDGTCTVLKGVTLTIEEGTQIQMSAGSRFRVLGDLIAAGTKSDPICIFNNDIEESSLGPVTPGRVFLNHAIVTGNIVTRATEINSCEISPIRDNWRSVVAANIIRNSNLYNCEITAVLIEKSIIHIENTDYINWIGAEALFESTVIYNDASIASFNIGYAESCAIYGTWSHSNTIFNNCIFTNHFSRGNRYITFKNYEVTMTKFLQDTDTNSTYVQFQLRTEYAENDVSHQTVIEELCERLDGYLVCMETPEEYDFLQKRGFSGLCGIAYGESQWVNQQPIDSWLTIYEDRSPAYSGSGRNYPDTYSEKAYVYMFYNDNYRYDTYSPNERYVRFGDSVTLSYEKIGGNFIIEIPNSANVLQKDDVINIVDSLESHIKYSLYSCSVINNFNNKYLTYVAGNSRADYDDCETKILPEFYWGTTDLELIEAQIDDYDDSPYMCDQIDPTGFLTEAPSDTMPFVVDAYLLNQNGERVRTVNNETVTFVVEFNRDMDTSVPLKVTFGSSAEYFYEDYNISEHGKWVTPRRWEATYTLKTIIENGNHTIKIENGCAADDEWLKLYDVPGRFMFEIDTTAAQALIMQGHATETGIQLSWMQDDYDTLMGYNVYRSDREDGYYQRLNSAVIPYDQKEFFDDTVEPGKVYYYNFTVVKTDLTESEPSGKISLMSMDTMAPNMYHSPVYSARTGANLIIGATVTDNLGVHEVVLYYRAVGETEWRKTSMTALNSRYTGIIPAEFLSLEGMEYYLCAYDGINYTYKGSADSPYVVAVQLAVDDSALGDVDGDGIITNKDALMLLQAANDLLNLTEEQFLRADINKDGELSASEALRILQYVSGKVTTIGD